MTPSARASLSIALLVSSAAIGPTVSAQKPKGPTNWPCTLTFRDGSGDAVQSDGKGGYVNGISGVHCVVVPPDSGSLTKGDLSLYFDNGGKNRRALIYTEQNGGAYPGYPTFSDAGSLRVNVVDLGPGRVLPVKRVAADDETALSIASWDRRDDAVIYVFNRQILRRELGPGAEQVLHEAPGALNHAHTSPASGAIVFVEFLERGGSRLGILHPDSTLKHLLESEPSERLATPTWLPGDAGIVCVRHRGGARQSGGLTSQRAQFVSCPSVWREPVTPASAPTGGGLP